MSDIEKYIKPVELITIDRIVELIMQQKSTIHEDFSLNLFYDDTAKPEEQFVARLYFSSKNTKHFSNASFHLALCGVFAYIDMNYPYAKMLDKINAL